MLVFIGSYNNGLTTMDGEAFNLVEWSGLTGISEEEAILPQHVSKHVPSAGAQFS